MKALIFDSGPLINLSMNGLLYVLEDLKKTFKGKMLITKEVKYEVIDHPLGIQRYELGALNIQRLLDLKVLELPSSLGISDETIKQRTTQLTDIANHYVQVKGQWVKVVSQAEMSCLALSDELSRKEIDNIIAIDERTTRVLCENPSNFIKIMSDRLHQKVDIVAKDFQIFSKYKFIRSPEIVFVAYKKGLIKLQGRNVLEALLYATKYKGSSITFEEIDSLKKL